MFQHIWAQSHLKHGKKPTQMKTASKPHTLTDCRKINNILIAGGQRKPKQNISLVSKYCQWLFDGIHSRAAT